MTDDQRNQKFCSNYIKTSKVIVIINCLFQVLFFVDQLDKFFLNNELYDHVKQSLSQHY